MGGQVLLNHFQNFKSDIYVFAKKERRTLSTKEREALEEIERLIEALGKGLREKMKLPKINFEEMKFPVYMPTEGFMSQWCCQCGLRHIWHFIVLRGKEEKDDEIYIDMFRDFKAERLRKFYEKSKKEFKRGVNEDT